MNCANFLGIAIALALAAGLIIGILAGIGIEDTFDVLKVTDKQRKQKDD